MWLPVACWLSLCLYWRRPIRVRVCHHGCGDGDYVTPRGRAAFSGHPVGRCRQRRLRRRDPQGPLKTPSALPHIHRSSTSSFMFIFLGIDLLMLCVSFVQLFGPIDRVLGFLLSVPSQNSLVKAFILRMAGEAGLEMKACPFAGQADRQCV